MESNDLNDQVKTDIVPEAANSGIIRPPFIYLGAIALGLLFHFASPVRLVPRAVSVPFGGIIVLVAVALFFYAVRTFRIAGTPVPGNRPTTTIVCAGPIVGAAIRSIWLSRCSNSELPAGSTVSGYSSPSFQQWR